MKFIQVSMIYFYYLLDSVEFNDQVGWNCSLTALNVARNCKLAAELNLIVEVEMDVDVRWLFVNLMTLYWKVKAQR